uniref:Uncharacterized protein n=1 Tax=Schistocephalus solidus TaxID=70667 RepID=A0A0V0J805_SCHSO
MQTRSHDGIMFQLCKIVFRSLTWVCKAGFFRGFSASFGIRGRNRIVTILNTLIDADQTIGQHSRGFCLRKGPGTFFRIASLSCCSSIIDRRSSVIPQVVYISISGIVRQFSNHVATFEVTFSKTVGDKGIAEDIMSITIKQNPASLWHATAEHG